MQSRGTDHLDSGRRTFMKTVGATALAASVFSGAAAADPKFPHNNENTATEWVAHSSGIETFLTTNKAGKPTMLGVWMPEATYDAVTASPAPAHYHVDLPRMDGLNFTFAGIDWNPQGHPPAGVWTVPHFDFHFYLMDEAAVEAIPPGVPTYVIPDERMPEGYLTEDLLGAPSRFVVPGMGEHLADGDAAAPPVTYIYGAYDTDDDDLGELTFVEPMVTQSYLDSLSENDGEHRQSVGLPEVFPEAGYYPTEYAVRYFGKEGAFLVTLEAFEWFDGYAAA